MNLTFSGRAAAKRIGWQTRIVGKSASADDGSCFWTQESGKQTART